MGYNQRCGCGGSRDGTQLVYKIENAKELTKTTREHESVNWFYHYGKMNIWNNDLHIIIIIKIFFIDTAVNIIYSTVVLKNDVKIITSIINLDFFIYNYNKQIK